MAARNHHLDDPTRRIDGAPPRRSVGAQLVVEYRGALDLVDPATGYAALALPRLWADRGTNSLGSMDGIQLSELRRRFGRRERANAETQGAGAASNR